MFSIGKKWKKRLIAVGVVVALLAIACATFPALWGPCLAVKAVRAFLPRMDGAENRLTVRHVGLGGIEIADVALDGVPFAPSCKLVSVRYSFSGLRHHRVDSVEVRGLSFNPARKVPRFSLPSPGNAGVHSVPDDPLRGWTIGRLSIDTADVDLSAVLPPPAAALFKGTDLSATLSAVMENGHCSATLRGRALGGGLGGHAVYSPAEAKGHAALSWRPALNLSGTPDLGEIAAKADFAFSGTNGLACALSGTAGISACPWELAFKAVAGPDGATGEVALAKTGLSETDPLLATILAVAPIPDTISDLRVSGDVSARVTFQAAGGEPSWRLDATLSAISLALSASGIPLTANGGRTRLGIEGVGAFWRLMPVPVSFESATAGMLSFDRGFAFLRADEKSLMVSEIDIGFCGGHVRLYALYLNFEKLNSGFTVILDNLKAGPFIEQFPALAGSTATGTLYGRLPLRIQEGGKVRLSDGFIYSPPGETGHISVADPTFIIEALGQAGVPPLVCGNFGKALRDLDYDTLRFDLHQPRQLDGRIAIRLRGKSTNGKVTTPVDIDINVKGALEKMLNLAVKTAKLKDQKSTSGRSPK